MAHPATTEAPRARGHRPGQRQPGESHLRNRDRLYTWLTEHPPAEVSASEIDQHFQAMPARYWERVRKGELTWGLQMVHSYFEKIAQVKVGKSGQIVAGAQHCPERGFTK